MWNTLSDLLLLLAMGLWLGLWLLRELGVLGVRRGAALPRPTHLTNTARRERASRTRRLARRRIVPATLSRVRAARDNAPPIPDTVPESVPAPLLDALSAAQQTTRSDGHPQQPPSALSPDEPDAAAPAAHGSPAVPTSPTVPASSRPPAARG